jgi:deazaflavin-dependent oxidoreductase (nitroreductase family)
MEHRKVVLFMKKGDISRWLYRGKRPHIIAKFFIWLWATIGSTGIAKNFIVKLEVTGRKSGRTVALPLVMVVSKGQRYLVSMLGDNVQWVQNVRAAGGKAVLSQGGRQEVQLVEIPVEQRASILKAYLQRAPGARPHIPVSKDAPVSEFEKVVAEYPVFRVVSLKVAS